jgi:thiamine-monophosphate kinase
MRRGVGSTVAMLGEDALLTRIARLLGPAPAGVLGIGDDAAVAPPGTGPMLLTTDVLVEGTHFRREWTLPEEVGWKALAVNLSDAAAMGGRPRHALVSLILPPETLVESVLALYRGMRRLASRSGTAVLGGNLARGKPLSLTLALVGDFPGGDPVLRSGARPGDRIYVTGQPGLARLGLQLLERERSSGHGRRGAGSDPWEEGPRCRREMLERRRRLAGQVPAGAAALRRLLRPEPRLEVAGALALPRSEPDAGRPLPRPTAMIDVSDGLAMDLPRLAKASGVSLIIDLSALPASSAFRASCATLRKSPEHTALQGGEDYELLFTLPPRANVPRRIGRVAIHPIGQVAPGSGVLLRDRAGDLHPLDLRGFDHFRSR